MKHKERPTISGLMPTCIRLQRELNKKLAKDKANENLEKYNPEDDSARGSHPFEDGWRINDDGYWQKII